MADGAAMEQLHADVLYLRQQVDAAFSGRATVEELQAVRSLAVDGLHSRAAEADLSALRGQLNAAARSIARYGR